MGGCVTKARKERQGPYGRKHPLGEGHPLKRVPPCESFLIYGTGKERKTSLIVLEAVELYRRSEFYSHLLERGQFASYLLRNIRVIRA